MQHIVIRGAHPYGLPLKYKYYPNILRRWAIKHTLWANGIRASIKRITLPTQRGFDSHLATGPVIEDYYNRPALKTTWVLTFRDNEKPVVLADYEGLYSTEIYTNKSVDIILNKTKNSTKPLFLYLAHQSVHAGDKQQPYRRQKTM